MRKIPFLKPNLVKKEAFLHYFDQIEESRLYTNYGPLNSLFEQRVLNEYFDGVGDVTTVNNATTGLILAISQTKRKNARYALMPSFTFAATPLAAMWCSLEPYFIDAREDNWCMDEALLKEVICKLGCQVAVVVPYAAFGTDLDLSIYREFQDSGVPIVVDAAASFGTRGIHGHFGHDFQGVVVYSFHATKPFAIGEGGLVYSGQPNIIAQVRQAGNFGFSNQRESTLQGLNSKISEYTAAIALSTLDVFPQKIKIRQKIYDWYLQYMERLGLMDRGWSIQKSHGLPVHQFMSTLCPLDLRNKFYIQRLVDMDIEARTYFSPACHQQEQFTKFQSTSMVITEKLSRCIVSLPLWEEMAENDVERIVGVIA